MFSSNQYTTNRHFHTFFFSRHFLQSHHFPTNLHFEVTRQQYQKSRVSKINRYFAVCLNSFHVSISISHLISTRDLIQKVEKERKLILWIFHFFQCNLHYFHQVITLYTIPYIYIFPSLRHIFFSPTVHVKNHSHQIITPILIIWYINRYRCILSSSRQIFFSPTRRP